MSCCPPALPRAQPPAQSEIRRDGGRGITRLLAVEVPELPTIIKESVVQQGECWQAHTDSVRSLQLIDKPPYLLSSGSDLNANLWGYDGSLIRTLRQNDPTWLRDAPFEVARDDNFDVIDMMKKLGLDD